jgi:SSS family solute:Na+ symporter/sodium/proline symporter
MVTKLCILIVFVAVTVAIGIWTRKSTTSVDGFVLAGRNVGPWLTAFAYGTSYFSAVVFIGYAGQFGWKYGMSATWAGIGNAIIGSLLAWIVLGSRTRRMSRALGSQTMPEFFGTRYGSRGLRIAAAFIIFIFLIPYTASVYNGLSRLFNMAFGLPYEACIIGMAIITCVYVVLGGYKATVVNDTLQGCIMLVSITAVVIAVIAANGGLAEATSAMAQVSSESEGIAAGSMASLFGPDWSGLLTVVLLTSLGTWGLPQMVQKFYAIRDDAAVKRGAIISTVFALVVAGGSYFLGGFGRLYADQITYSANGTPVYDSIIPTMLSTVPELLIGIVVVLVLSASMSTLSSLVLTSSSTLTLDFLKGNVVKKMNEEQSIVWMRGFIVLFVALSAVIALVQYNSSITFIAQLMGISWGALAGAFLAPFLYGLYWKGATPASVWASFVFGVGITVGNMIWGFVGSSLLAGVIAMLAGLVIVPVVSLFTKKTNPQCVEAAFSGLANDGVSQVPVPQIGPDPVK